MSSMNMHDQFEKELLDSRKFFHRSSESLGEADSGFRPTEDMMTAAQQVAHAATTIEWFIDGANSPEGFDLDFSKHARALENVTSLNAEREHLNAAYDKALQFLKAQSPEQLTRPLPPGPVMGGEPVSEIFWAIVEHTAHHRGALTVYSRLTGKVPPMPYA